MCRSYQEKAEGPPSGARRPPRRGTPRPTDPACENGSTGPPLPPSCRRCARRRSNAQTTRQHPSRWGHPRPRSRPIGSSNAPEGPQRVSRWQRRPAGSAPRGRVLNWSPGQDRGRHGAQRGPRRPPERSERTDRPRPPRWPPCKIQENRERAAQELQADCKYFYLCQFVDRHAAGGHARSLAPPTGAPCNGHAPPPLGVI